MATKLRVLWRQKHVREHAPKGCVENTFSLRHGCLLVSGTRANLIKRTLREVEEGEEEGGVEGGCAHSCWCSGNAKKVFFGCHELMMVIEGGDPEQAQERVENK